jgi:glutamyl-tRNA synthetase
MARNYPNGTAPPALWSMPRPRLLYRKPILNYLVRLGWSHGDQEIFSLDEMAELFDLEGCNKAASAINPSKLIWLNKHYLKTLDPVHVARHLSWHIGQLGIDPCRGTASD